jgi:hypothetical protein
VVWAKVARPRALLRLVAARPGALVQPRTWFAGGRARQRWTYGLMALLVAYASTLREGVETLIAFHRLVAEQQPWQLVIKSRGAGQACVRQEQSCLSIASQRPEQVPESLFNEHACAWPHLDPYDFVTDVVQHVMFRRQGHAHTAVDVYVHAGDERRQRRKRDNSRVGCSGQRACALRWDRRKADPERCGRD